MRLRRQSCPLEAVDAGGDAGGAKPVVDVDDGNIRSAGIEHAQERRDPAETGAIADASRHGNDRCGDEATNDAGKRAFHSRNANNDASLRQLAFAMPEQAVNASDANVVELIYPVAHHARGEKGFFGDGNVAGTGGNDKDQALAGNFAAALNGNDAGERMEFRGARRLAVGLFDGGEGFSVGTGDENVVVRVFFLKHGADDTSDMLRRLALGEDDFGKTLAQGAMVVDFRETEVLEWKMFKPFNGRAGREFSAPHGFQDFQ